MKKQRGGRDPAQLTIIIICLILINTRHPDFSRPRSLNWWSPRGNLKISRSEWKRVTMRLPRMKRRVTHYGWTQTIRRRMSVMVWIMADPRDSWTIPASQTVGFSRPHTTMPIPRYMTSHSLPPKLFQRGRNSHLTIRMRMIVVLSQMKKRTKYFCSMVTIQHVVSAGPAIAVVIFLIKKITLRCRTSGTSLVGIFWLRWARVRSKIGKLLHIRCPLRLSRLTPDAFTWGRRILTLGHVTPVKTALLFPLPAFHHYLFTVWNIFSSAKGNVPSIPSVFFEMLSAFLWQAFVICFVEASHRPFQDETISSSYHPAYCSRKARTWVLYLALLAHVKAFGGGGQVIQQR